jgi:hypothetical protein
MPFIIDDCNSRGCGRMSLSLTQTFNRKKLMQNFTFRLLHNIETEKYEQILIQLSRSDCPLLYLVLNQWNTIILFLSVQYFNCLWMCIIHYLYDHICELFYFYFKSLIYYICKLHESLPSEYISPNDVQTLINGKWSTQRIVGPRECNSALYF